MLFRLRRKEVPWEVVDNSSIEPVLTLGEDLRICDVGKDIEGTYVFDVPSAGDHHQFRRALSFSRCLLMAEASRRGYNTLSMESWRLTILRKGRHIRVEIRYGGRPARALGKVPSKALPPFINILERHKLFSSA